MEIVRQLENLKPQWPYPVLTIGNFDGVHKGHQQIIARLIEQARRNQGTRIVLTFDPHPTKILAPYRAPKSIQTLEQKVRTLQDLGVDVLLILPFTHALSQWSARDFAVKILGEGLGVKELYVGADFTFGRGREGHVPLLEEVGREKGFVVGAIPEITFRGLRISSTGIRRYLTNGQVALGRRLLGRPYSIQGIVTTGQRLGTSMGFPTANIQPENEIVPKFGVYITYLYVDGRRYESVTNIGIRPTFNAGVEDAEPTIETFVFGFQGDLYRRSVRLDFCTRLRDERTFPGKEALVAQIQKDVRLSQSYFSKRSKAQC